MKNKNRFFDYVKYLEFLQALGEYNPRRALRISKCVALHDFRRFERNQTCKDAWCPHCNRVRANSIRISLEVMQSCGLNQMMTLTWSEPVLRGQVQRETHKRARYIAAIARHTAAKLYWRVEYSFRQDGSVHLHFHTLISARHAPAFKAEFDAWLKRYADYSPVRNVHEVIKYLSPTYSAQSGELAAQTRYLHTSGNVGLSGLIIKNAGSLSRKV